jgi:formate dehydrogenase maturation protein FdhE
VRRKQKEDEVISRLTPDSEGICPACGSNPVLYMTPLRVAFCKAMDGNYLKVTCPRCEFSWRNELFCPKRVEELLRGGP